MINSWIGNLLNKLTPVGVGAVHGPEDCLHHLSSQDKELEERRELSRLVAILNVNELPIVTEYLRRIITAR